MVRTGITNAGGTIQCLARLTGLAGHARGATGQTVQGFGDSRRDGFPWIEKLTVNKLIR